MKTIYKTKKWVEKQRGNLRIDENGQVYDATLYKIQKDKNNYLYNGYVVKIKE